MPSLAERLGFGPTDRVAVIHVDDIAMCHDANRGAFEALENGPATCGSIMVPCPWFEAAAARARANPRLDLGVHLTLNAEWEHYRWGPVAGPSAVSSLVDARGGLLRTTLETVQRAKPEEVELELRAQIDRALEAGVDVTHLDSHMGTCFHFLEIYTRLAICRIRPVCRNRSSSSNPRAWRRIPGCRGDRTGTRTSDRTARPYRAPDGLCQKRNCRSTEIPRGISIRYSAVLW